MARRRHERLFNRIYYVKGRRSSHETVHHIDATQDVGKMDDMLRVRGWLGKSMASDRHQCLSQAMLLRSGGARKRRGGRPEHWTSLSGRRGPPCQGSVQ